MMNPIAFVLAVDATRAHVNSAMPHAPVVPEPHATPSAVRLWAARTLRRAADLVEPAPACASG
jgi:hypothetical protein